MVSIPPVQPPPPPPVLPRQTTLGIPYSKFKLVKSIIALSLFAVIFLICGGFIEPRWVGWCLIVVGALAVVMIISEFRKLFDKSQVLVFGATGLTDNSAKPPVTIAWSDIQKVTLFTRRVNGIPSSRTLILDLPEIDGASKRHKIDLDTLKGSPKVIAETVLVWANNGRPAAPFSLLEEAAEQDKSA